MMRSSRYREQPVILLVRFAMGSLPVQAALGSNLSFSMSLREEISDCPIRAQNNAKNKKTVDRPMKH